jgi:hypothetical protein
VTSVEAQRAQENLKYLCIWSVGIQFWQATALTQDSFRCSEHIIFHITNKRKYCSFRKQYLVDSLQRIECFRGNRAAANVSVLRWERQYIGHMIFLQEMAWPQSHIIDETKSHHLKSQFMIQ